MDTVHRPSLLTLAYLQIGAVIAHGIRLRPTSVARAGFRVQPRQAPLPKPVDSLVDL
jgi:hypothetical protein